MAKVRSGYEDDDESGGYDAEGDDADIDNIMIRDGK